MTGKAGIGREKAAADAADAPTNWSLVALGVSVSAFGAYLQFKLPPILPAFLAQYPHSPEVAAGFMSVFALVGLLASAPLGRLLDRRALLQAVFAGLDKITGRIIKFDAEMGETVQFGALRVKPQACYTRPSTEAANTDAFVEVDEITLQGEVKRIFSGWMFAASPGLHGVEHPIYDIWLTDCKGPSSTVAQQEKPKAAPPPPPPPQQSKRPARPPAQRPLPPPNPFPPFQR